MAILCGKCILHVQRHFQSDIFKILYLVSTYTMLYQMRLCLMLAPCNCPSSPFQWSFMSFGCTKISTKSSFSTNVHLLSIISWNTLPATFLAILLYFRSTRKEKCFGCLTISRVLASDKTYFMYWRFYKSATTVVDFPNTLEPIEKIDMSYFIFYFRLSLFSLESWVEMPLKHFTHFSN